MKKFSKITAKVSYLPITNVDTDKIIPKEYLKTIKRSGLGKYLFSELRYDSQGYPIEDFILNKRADTKILLSGENFGCGSSREHAVWSILDFGIDVVIAPSFADIFYGNSFKNGLLLVIMPKTTIEALAKEDSLTVDLENQKIISEDKAYDFSIEPYLKDILLNGLDDIEKALEWKDDIYNFERFYKQKYSWL